MEAAQFKLVGVLPPLPIGKRANRIRWHLNPAKDKSNLLAYGVQKNCVIMDLQKPFNTVIYNKLVLNPICCVKWNTTGTYLAFGDVNGVIKIIGKNADGQYTEKLEKNALDGEVQDFGWTNDNPNKLVVVGSGKRRAFALNIDSGSGSGEVTGHMASLLTCDVKVPKPFKLIVTGEDKEIQVHKGAPFKHENTVSKVHTGFVTKCGFTPWDESAHFVTVSQDKMIKVHNLESLECIIEHQTSHTMGINDFCFIPEPGMIATCSSDRSVKTWKIDFEEKKIEEMKTMNISEIDDKDYTDNVDKQNLGIIYDDNSKCLMSINCASDVNIWGFDGEGAPNGTIRGHKNAVTSVLKFGEGTTYVSTDLDGRLFTWDPRHGNVQRPASIYKHKIQIVTACCNDQFLYTGSADMHIMQFSKSEGNILQPSQPDLIQKHSSVLKMVAAERFLYILYSDKSMEILNAENISEVLLMKEKDKMGLKGDVNAMTLVEAKNELWVADTTGLVNILDAGTLEPLTNDEGVIELKTVYGKEGMAMATSNNGTMVAVGDKKGYTTLFMTEDRS